MGGQMDSHVSLQVYASCKNLYYISCIIQLTCNQLVLWAPACVDLHWWPNDEKLVSTCIDLYRIWVRSKSMQVGGQIWLTLIRIPNPHILRKSGFLVISCFLHGRYALPGNMQLPPRTVVLKKPSFRRVNLQFPEEVCSSQTKPVGKRKNVTTFYTHVLRVLCTRIS